MYEKIPQPLSFGSSSLVEGQALFLSAWPWRWTHYDPLKCWYLFTKQHSIIFQKSWVFS